MATGLWGDARSVHFMRRIEKEHIIWPFIARGPPDMRWGGESAPVMGQMVTGLWTERGSERACSKSGREGEGFGLL